MNKDNMSREAGSRSAGNDVFIGKGNLDGKGVFAARDFQKGETIIKYNLKHLTQDEFNALPESEKEFTHVHKGVIDLYSPPERYVNHSDTPNTIQDLEIMADIAARDIKEGEEITTDATKDDI